MSERDRAARARRQRIARWARGTPGYRAAVQHVLPAVRRNATLTDVVWRVFIPSHGAGTLPVPFHAGRHLTGRDTVLLPVVGILGLGLTAEQVAALVEQVAGLQRAERSFRPLLVLDRPAFTLARRHGFVVEVVVPEATWATHPQGGDRGGDARTEWLDHLGQRLAGIVDHYQLWHLARAGADGLDQVDLALLRAIADRLPDDLDVRVTAGDGDEGVTGSA